MLEDDQKKHGERSDEELPENSALEEGFQKEVNDAISGNVQSNNGGDGEQPILASE